MGLIQGTVTQRGTYYRSYIYWWETEVNNANNTSRLNIQVLIDTTNTGINWNGTCSNSSYTIDGTYTGVSNFNSNTSSGWTYSAGNSPTGRASQLIMSGSKVITHNTDGSYTANLSTYFSLPSGGYGPGNVSISGTAELTTIPRASTPASLQFFVGDTVTFAVNRLSSSFTHTLELYINSIKVLERTNVETFLQFQPTSEEVIAMYDAIPNSNKGISYIKCITFSGSTQIGEPINSDDRYATINSAGNLPTIPSITWEENESTNKTLTSWTTAISTDNGKTIQNKTKFKINCATGVAQNGASITTYKAVINGNTYTSTTPTIITGLISDSDTLKVSVIDSRTFESTLIEKVIVVLPYEEPYFTSPTAVRKTYPNNQTVTLEFSAKLAKLMKTYGTKGTAYKLEYQFKKTIDVSYNSLATLIYTVDTEGAITYNSDLSNTFDKDFSYNIKIRLTDYYTYKEEDLLVPTDTPLISKRKGKVGIGKVPTQGMLDVAGDIYSNNIKLSNTVINDTLTSTSTTEALSAKQGKELDTKISTLAGKTHQMICGASSANVTAGTTTYLGLKNSAGTYSGFVTSCAGTISNLHTYADGSPGVGQTYTYTVVVDNTPSAVTCQTSAGTNNSTDTTHSVTCTANQRVSVKCVLSGSASTTGVIFGFMFTPS